MLLLKERLRQKYRTLDWPRREPALSQRYRGMPLLVDVQCGNCMACYLACPCQALIKRPDMHTPILDMGRCIFCGACQRACPKGVIAFSHNYRLAAQNRDDLLVRPLEPGENPCEHERPVRNNGIFRRSLKLRQVSAGGCNACEADCNVLSTLVYDLGRFGIDFTASPRHADGLVVTGPVSAQMLPALLDTWEAVPRPRVLVAVGACAISGGLFRQSADCRGGLSALEGMQADVFVPGCPPNPWSILDGLLSVRRL